MVMEMNRDHRSEMNVGNKYAQEGYRVQASAFYLEWELDHLVSFSASGS